MTIGWSRYEVAGLLNFSRACGARIEIGGLWCACLISRCPWEIEAESACEFLNPDFYGYHSYCTSLYGHIELYQYAPRPRSERKAPQPHTHAICAEIGG